MELRLLGPMEIYRDGLVAELAGAKRRALVAMLAVRPGQARDREQIAEDLWDGRPPPSAVSTVKGYVSKIRKVLGDEVLRTTPAGYALQLARSDVDTARFEDTVRWSMSAPDLDAGAVAGRLGEALALWQGPALSEFRDATWARVEANRLDNLREAGLERWIDARLDIGDHAALVSDIDALVAEFPLRERFWAQLMVALYRCGRQADALRAFARLRRLLAEELGIDPSRDLVELETAILTQDTSLQWVPAANENGKPAAAVSSSNAGPPIAEGVASCTLMLTDIEGSTQLWERHPREMATAIRRHQEIITAAVNAAGGEVVKPRGEGDSTFSVFRLASDAATAAANAMRTLELEAWAGEVQLRVRIAVHTGEIELRDGDYYGTTVNRAARLRALAAGGQVLLSGTTSGLVIDTLPDGSTLIDLGLRPLRDLSRPEHIYELSPVHTATATSAVATVELASLSSLEWEPTRKDAPFVGRTDVLEALQGCWASALVGRRQLVFVAGEPGAGKSRLAAEHARTVREQGGLVLYGRWDEEPISPFQGFLEALGTYSDRCPPSVLLEDIRSLAGDLAPLFPQLATYGDSNLTGRPSTESERFRLFEAIDAWLRRIAARCPVLLVLDDLHWADRPALLLLRHLARSSGERVMIVGAYRDTDAHAGSELAGALADLRRGAGFARIELSPFSADDIDELLHTFSGGELSIDVREFARQLLAETSGNAFFISEIAWDLIGTGAQRPGRVPPTPARMRVPESIREMVASRVGRLSVACADMLRVASVTGAEFGVSVLRKVARLDAAALDGLLDEAEQSRLVRVVPPGSDTYAFEHAIVRHVLHDTLSAARRRRLHRRTAEVLELEHSTDRGRRVAELAYHFCEGADDDVADKAVRYARNAGDDARAQLAFESAADHYRRAIAVLERHAADPLLRCELLLAAGDASNRAGQSQIGKDDFVAAAGAARSLQRTDLLVRAALGYGGELPASLEPDERAQQLLQEALDALGTHDELARACALGRLAQWTYFVAPPSTRVAYCDEAVRLARSHDDLRVLATVLTSRCRALEGPEDLEGQISVADEIIALGEKLADREVVLQGLRCRLHRVFESGDIDEANAIVARIRELAGSLRSPEYLRLVTSWDGLTAGTQGRFREASRYMSETIALMAGHPQTRRVLYFQALLWRALQQRLDDRIDLVVAAATAEPDVVLWRALWAWFAAETGQYEVASEQLDHINFAALEPANRRFDFFHIFVAMTIAIGRTGDEARAKKLYDLASPYAGRNCTAGFTAFYGAVDHYLGVLRATANDGPAAIAHFEAALTRHVEMRAEPYVAMTQMALADQLATRSGEGDEVRAVEVRAEASATAERLGLTALLALPIVA